jgi:hypothetical protein
VPISVAEIVGDAATRRLWSLHVEYVDVDETSGEAATANVGSPIPGGETDLAAKVTPHGANSLTESV